MARASSRTVGRSLGGPEPFSGPFRFSLLAATLLGLVAACSTTGGAVGTIGAPPSPSSPSAPSPSSPSAPSPSFPSPSASSEPSVPASPSSSIPAGRVRTPEDAIAAVVALHPEFSDHVMLPAGDPLIGMSAWVVVSGQQDGFRVTFVTGSGDCPAGCMEHRLDVFIVRREGTVMLECSLPASPTDVTPDGNVPADPCAGADE